MRKYPILRKLKRKQGSTNRAKNTLNNKKHTFRLSESDEITTKGVQTPNNKKCQCTFIHLPVRKLHLLCEMLSIIHVQTTKGHVKVQFIVLSRSWFEQNIIVLKYRQTTNLI